MEPESLESTGKRLKQRSGLAYEFGSPPTMDVSVIICTYNRCESLRKTLETFCTLVIPQDLKWELVVVDNNSTDGTRPVCMEFAGRLPMQYAFEPRQGKSTALNRIIPETKGSLLLFTDDDVDVDVNWITAFWHAASRHPQASFFGGKIIPRWETPPPSWLAEHADDALRVVSLHFDKGNEDRVLAENEYPFWGANLSIRKEVFQDGVQFREDMGPQGDVMYGQATVTGEEVELQTRLMRTGCLGVYVPSAVVHHRNARHRMTERYVRKWFLQYGIKEVRFGLVGDSEHQWFGAPRYLWRKLITGTIIYGLSRWTCRSGVWLPAEIQMARTWGTIREWRRRRNASVVNAGRS